MGGILGYIPAGLIIIVYLTVMLNFFLARNKSRRTDYGAFMDEESAANSARKREIDPRYLVAPDIGALPFSGGLAEEDEVKKTAGLPMIRFDKALTNNELKLMYGAASLGEITGMEENYARFITAMLSWAGALIGICDYSGAEAVLNETVRMGSDFSRSYTLLADIRRVSGDASALAALRETVSGKDLFNGNEELRQKILRYIDSER